MPSPYITGNWVTGAEFYGRAELRAALAAAPDRATYVMGTRRVGKTSLLRQAALDLAPLGVYIDLMQAAASDGGQTVLDEGRLVRLLRRELGRLSRGSPALAATRATWDRESAEICAWLEEAAWAWEEQGATVTLLWDEAELLLRMAPASLMCLRSVVQGGVGLRMVLCASRGLAAINERWRDEGSPFLFGFRTRALGGLDAAAAEALIRRGGAVAADPATVAALYAASGGHPYLLQLLCDRLFAEGGLRPPGRADLLVDEGLADLFRIDAAQLSPGERAVLVAAGGHGPIDGAGLSALVRLDPDQAARFAHGLAQTGQLRMEQGRWAAGNALLAQWLQAGADPQPPLVSDRASLEVAALTGRGAEPMEEPLSDRERTVLRLMAAGRRNGEIAELLVISAHTAKAHVKSIYRKLGVSDRVQAINKGRAAGLV